MADHLSNPSLTSPPLMHPAKRRRMESSASTLSKPFKSPLRVGVKTETQRNDCNEQIGLSTDSRPKTVDSGVVLHSHAPSEQANTSSPLRRLPTLLSSSPPAAAKDPEYLSLQKQHSRLLRELTKARQSLDTAQQALKIRASKQDSELEELIAKWKRVSREAAEEIFRDAKDRVNRMGGVAIWRERTRQKPKGWGAEDDSYDLDELTEEQREQMEIHKEEIQAEREKYGLGMPEEVAEKDDQVRQNVESQLMQCVSGSPLLISNHLQWT